MTWCTCYSMQANIHEATRSEPAVQCCSIMEDHLMVGMPCGAGASQQLQPAVAAPIHTDGVCQWWTDSTQHVHVSTQTHACSHPLHVLVHSTSC
jgi:hypothetical protein